MIKKVLFLSICWLLPVGLYSFPLEVLEFDREAPQNFCSERETIAKRQGSNENKNSGVEPTQSKREPSSGPSLSAWDCILEGKIAYYYPTQKAFRNVYAGNAIYGVECSFQTFRQLYSWASLDCFYTTGHTSGGDSASVTLVPLSVGLKYLYNHPWLQPYVGAGGTACYARTHVDSNFLIPTRVRWGGGGVIKSGLLFTYDRHFVADLFMDYSFIYAGTKNTRSRPTITYTLNASGLSFGGKLGYRF